MPRSVLRLALASLVALVLAACPGPGTDPADGGTPAAPDLHRRLGPGEVVAGVLGEDGPFIDHEGRTARAGDLLLKNDRVQFVVEALRPSDFYVEYGGGIIDADLVREDGDPAYDGILELHPLVGLAPVEPVTLEIVDDGTGGGPAHVRMVGREGVLGLLSYILGSAPATRGFEVQVDYRLPAGASALEITTTVFHDGDDAVGVQVGDYALLGDHEADPFTLPGGFDRGATIMRSLVYGSAGEVRPFAMAAFGEAELTPIGGEAILDVLGGADATVWLYAAGSARLRPGDELVVRRWLSLGRDVAEAVAPMRVIHGQATGRVTGQVTAGGEPLLAARVSFLEAGIEPPVFVSQAVTGADGSFAADLPPGTYTAVVTADGRGEEVEVEGLPRTLADGHAPGTPETVTVAAGGEANLTVELAPAGRVQLSVVDGDGVPVPAKVTFVDEGPVESLRPAIGERRPYASQGFRKVFWTPDGAVSGRLRPGTYTVTASRGPAFEIDTRQGVVVESAGTTELSFVVVGSVDRTGFLAMDSHMHAAGSPHGEASLAERVITAAAEGLDVHVSTEHDRVVDYRPLVEALGLRSWLLSIPGDEISTVFSGHHNAWPLVPQPDAPNLGAPIWWNGASLEDLYEGARALGAQVIAVNHGGGERGYFGLSGYDPATGNLSRPEYFSWGFDAMEVHNGKGTGGRGGLLPIWYSLLDRGRRVTPLATSDSHRKIPEAGTGRTWLEVGYDDPAIATAGDVAQAVLELRTVASTGPLVRFSTADGTVGSGGLAAVDAGGAVRLAFDVQAPTWLRLDTVRLVANGEVLVTWDAASTPAVEAPVLGSGAVWFTHEVEVSPGQDTWYVVQTEGGTDMAPVVPGLTPWATTSPIFVDVDGNGRFDPPR